MGGSASFEMIKTISVSISILAFGLAVVGQVSFRSYTNDRFSFSIDYPASFKMQPPPENEDGRTFKSKDGATEMRVWGQYNAESLTLGEKYNLALKGFNTKPSYMVLGKTSFVVSGLKEGKIVYIKTLYRKGKDTDVYYTLTIEYPASQRNAYDSTITRIANSFKLIPGADI